MHPRSASSLSVHETEGVEDIIRNSCLPTSASYRDDEDKQTRQAHLVPDLFGLAWSAPPSPPTLGYDVPAPRYISTSGIELRTYFYTRNKTQAAQGSGPLRRCRWMGPLLLSICVIYTPDEMDHDTR